MPLDVLDHHDRVIHHPADRDGERPERDDVEGVSEGEHADEGDEHRGRDRNRRDEGGPHRHQEDEDHDHREEEPQRSLGGQRVDGLLDKRSLVEHDDQLCAVAEGLLEVGQGLPHLLGDGDRVACRGLRHRDGQRRGAIDPRDAGDRVVGDGDGGDIRDRARRTVDLHAHQGQSADVLHGSESGAGLHGETFGILGDRPGGEQAAVGVYRVADGLVADSRGREGVAVWCDDHSLHRGAEQIGLAHPVELPDVGEGCGGEKVAEVGGRQVAGDRDLNDRQVVDAAGDHSWVDSGGEGRLDAVDGLADLLFRRDEVGAVGEGCRDGRQARVRGRGRVFESRYTLHRLLDRGADILIHHLGRGAGVARDDHQLREGDRRDEFLLQRREGDGPEDADDDRDEGDQRPVAQAEDGEEMH